jgi:hypothetical protein
MTDYQRTTTRETTTDPYVSPAPAATSVRTTDTAHVPAGPGGATVASRIVTFAFGILQALLILRIILLLLVANPGNDIPSDVLKRLHRQMRFQPLHIQDINMVRLLVFGFLEPPQSGFVPGPDRDVAQLAHSPRGGLQPVVELPRGLPVFCFSRLSNKLAARRGETNPPHVSAFVE